MTVTREVVLDLLPLYEAGEASADTRALVEAFLRTDADLDRIVKAMRKHPVLPAPPTMAPAADVERIAVERTRKALRLRSWILAGALFFTLVPFSIVFRGGELTFFMLRDRPFARVMLVLGAILWISYAKSWWQYKRTGW